MHLPNQMNKVILGNDNLIIFAAVASSYATTGVSLTSDTFEDADRDQRCPLGADIPSIIYDITVRDSETPTAVEYAIFKIERAHAVPADDDVLLPTSTSISTSGIQAAVRRFQPGRVIKMGVFAVAKEQPMHRSIKGNYQRFKMMKLRTGDFYGIQIFNRGLGQVTVDVQMRYLAKV